MGHHAYSRSIAPAHGRSSGAHITLLPGLPPGEEFATLAHEFAHELLHQTHRRQTTRRIRETEAEAVAFVVCQAVGLDTNTASRYYIHLHGGDAEALAASLDAIRKTAALIISEIQPSRAPVQFFSPAP